MFGLCTHLRVNSESDTCKVGKTVEDGLKMEYTLPCTLSDTHGSHTLVFNWK